MTEEEYHKKRTSYASSDAPKEVIDEAIKKLDEQWDNQFNAMIEGGELDDIE
jgi:hypothetical protein